MSTDISLLQRAYQEFSISVDVLSPRQWRLADVDSTGFDTGDTFPPAADNEVFVPQVRYWHAIKDIGSISGSVDEGGWSSDITVPQQGEGLADLPDFSCIDLHIRTWHGGLPGVVGAAGIDPGRVKLFRAFIRHRQTNEEMDYGQVVYDLRSGVSFLQDSSFSRGIDWYPGSASHSAPVSLAELIDHLIFFHTNWHPRAEHSVYLPNTVYNTYELSEGSVYAMLKSIADNAVLEGWVFCGREGELVITGHPNLVGADIYGNGASTIATPIIEFDDTIVMNWGIPENTGYEIASMTVTAMTSDQQEITRTYYIPGGLGSRERWPVVLRSDDTDLLNLMTQRAALHANSRFKGVTITVPLNVSVNTGDIVLCTHRGKRLATQWNRKLFVVKTVVYDINLDAETFISTITLDEVLV